MCKYVHLILLSVQCYYIMDILMLILVLGEWGLDYISSQAPNNPRDILMLILVLGEWGLDYISSKALNNPRDILMLILVLGK